METVKLEEQELNQLKSIQTKYQETIISLGYAEYQLKIATEQKESVMVNLNKIDLEQKDYLKTLEDKYGEGSINLETGEFTKP